MEKQEKIQLAYSDYRTSTSAYLSKVQASSEFSDVTLACEGDILVPAHKLILSAGSSLFESLLSKFGSHPHQLLYLRGVKKDHLEEVLSFIYNGEASIPKLQLDAFLVLARDLGVRGFDEEDQNNDTVAKIDDIYLGNNVNRDKDGEKANVINKVEHIEAMPYSDTVVKPETEIIQSNHLLHISSEENISTSMWSMSNEDGFNLRRSPFYLGGFFNRLGKSEASCTTCQSVLRTTDGNTEGLKNHLLRKHLSKFAKFEEFKQKVVKKRDALRKEKDRYKRGNKDHSYGMYKGKICDGQ